jgi:deoxyribodipyrimidine photolyase
MRRPVSIVWFRQDFRLADNPALVAAVNRGAIIPVFIHAPEEEAPWPPGSASKWWLHQSLAALAARLRERGSRLVIRRGPTLESLRALVKETGATAVFWNRRYEPAVMARDAKVNAALRGEGLKVESFNAALLHEPWMIRNQSDKPFQVFTPFWKNCRNEPAPAEPLPAPKKIPAPAKWPRSLALDELGLEPKINWSGGLRAAWQPGEAGATANLRRFLARAFDDYTTLVKSARARSGTTCGGWRRSAGCRSRSGAIHNFWPNSAGANSPTICCSTFRTRPPNRSGRRLKNSRGAKTRPGCVPGKRAVPDTRWWTRACASCGRRAGCITGCG